MLLQARAAVQDGAVSALLGASGASSSDAAGWLVGHLFDSSRLVPVRRPHASDEVVANLAKHASSELSAGYLEDADVISRATRTHTPHRPRCASVHGAPLELRHRVGVPQVLRAATLAELRPAHHCELNAADAKQLRADLSQAGPAEGTNNAANNAAAAAGGQPPNLHSECARVVEWTGPELVKALEGWLKYGHVVEESDAAARETNTTAELERLSASFSQWLRRQCTGLKKELKRSSPPPPAHARCPNGPPHPSPCSVHRSTRCVPARVAQARA